MFSQTFFSVLVLKFTLEMIYSPLFCYFCDLQNSNTIQTIIPSFIFPLAFDTLDL